MGLTSRKAKGVGSLRTGECGPAPSSDTHTNTLSPLLPFFFLTLEVKKNPYLLVLVLCKITQHCSEI